MALFTFEKHVHNILKLNLAVSNSPVARWQRKTSTPTSAATDTGSLYPGISGNRSRSTSKTPGKKSKTLCKANKVGGDRYIPTRNSEQMEVASFLMSKENESPQTNQSRMKRKAWSMALNGFDVEEARILNFGGKPLIGPDGYQSNLKVLYNQVPNPAKKSRYISSVPDRVLDAPELRDDFYLDLMDWGKQNLLAVALDHTVYVWDASKGDILQLMKMEQEEDYISSVSWSKDGNFLAIGSSDCTVQLWDVEHQKRLRSMTSHTARVGSLSWNNHVLSSGARSGHIHHHDVRVAEHHISTLRGHTQEVCGLKWSTDGKYLASGGNDNMVYVWSGIQEGSAQTALHSFNDHQGAVKALAWCPWQRNILASGGGTSDRHIRIWNVNSGSCSTSLDTQSQISSLMFVPNYKELVSSHGFSDNLAIWKYPSLTKVADLFGHEGRVLNMALSPDGATIASVAADETIRLWNCFKKDPVKKPQFTPQFSFLNQLIR
ncbi:cell division cycle protein 20 homolog [Denticeps clupeoides]|uniref:CDC20/Fizzy WD40 domain-containing protein n=1 Tax=Denticeps clupeoides TaxID=299321 RepID=A0AAY4CZH2_9TELE|nr:cell division cycle protein 20 homolog [Denticeps clupeoides]